MNIEQYLTNQELISKLKKQNKEFIASIQETEIVNCPFKVGDVVKGAENSLSGGIGAITIGNLSASINNDGSIKMVGRGYRMNLDGSHSRNGSSIKSIILDKDTIKLN